MKTRDDLQKEFLEVAGLMYRCLLPSKSKAIRKIGLNRSQFQVLNFICHGNQPTIKEISDTFNITSSAATQLIEGLVQLKYVKRLVDASDRRLVKVISTKIGTQKIERFKQMVLEHLIPSLREVSDEELIAINRIARKIVDSSKQSIDNYGK